MGRWQEARDCVYYGERKRSWCIAALGPHVLAPLTLQLMIFQIRFKRIQEKTDYKNMNSFHEDTDSQFAKKHQSRNLH